MIGARMMAGAVALCMAGAAAAQDGGASRAWQVDVGVTRLSMADDARVAVAGATVPGGGVRSRAQVVPSLNVTRFVAPTIGVSLAAGWPPTIRYAGAGTLAPAGALLDVRYAAPAVTLLWSPLRGRTVAPYAGGGVTYMHVLSTRDRALRTAEVDDDAGAVLQAGVALFPTRRVGAFADVRNAFVRTVARGTFGGAPVETRLRMDPLVLQAGVSLRL